jgi:hypothetical protein
MEFLDGMTLKHRISGKPLPFDEMLELRRYFRRTVSGQW